MDKKANSFIKNFSYTITSNIVTLVIASLITLIIPKIMGIREYGYVQLYYLYISYIGFFHFGWVDGIYLKIGGRDYDSLEKEKFASQFQLLLMMEIIISCIACVVIYFIVSDVNKQFILYTTAACVIVQVMKTYILYILQSTNRIKEYAYLNLSDRVLYCIFVAALVLVGQRHFHLIVISDVVAKAIALLVGLYICKDIVFHKFLSLKPVLREAWDNISIGSKLMFANIASLLITGIVRFAIENHWDIETFGKVSLTMTVSNLLMVFVNAVSVVMFPMLRRMNGKNLPQLYSDMRNVIMVVLLGLLALYYPLKIVLAAWLPQYAVSLNYMALMFPMCIFDSKTSMLITTYLKTLRKEKTILMANVISVLLSILLTFLSVYLIKNLQLAVITIVALIAFKSVFSELCLSKYITINVIKDILMEVALVVIFILVSWFIKSWLCSALYIASYTIYLALKKGDIKITYDRVKLLWKK